MCAKASLYTREELIMQLITLHPVQSVTITILADNFFDGLLPDQGVAKRASLGTQKLGVTTALMEGERTFESPLAQHGFSALVTLTVGGQTHRLLFDTGATPDGLIANMHTFDISPKDIETIVLSHGQGPTRGASLHPGEEPVRSDLPGQTVGGAVSWTVAGDRKHVPFSPPPSVPLTRA